MYLHRLLAFALVVMGTLAHAQTKTPPYGDAPNGSANVAGREWLRCSLGQQWTGSNCVGQAKKYTFEGARAAANSFNATGYRGKQDWRVPTVHELQSLRVCSSGFVNGTTEIQGGKDVKTSCNGGSGQPSINTALFPQTPENLFWSSSFYHDTSSFAWVVYFGYGLISHSYIRSSSFVRLVR
jgi:hypothetical protein